MAEQLGDGERLARAALANGRGFFSAVGVVDHERVAVLRAALAACESEGVLRARLLAQLAMEVIYEGDWDARAALSDEAVALARRLGDAATFATVLYQRSVALWGVHGLKQRCSAVAEAERQLDWLADPVLAVHIAHQGVHAALASGDMALADRRLAVLREHAASAGLPTLAWYERVAASKRAFCAGRMREALALAFEAREIGTGAGQPDAVPWWGAQTFGAGLLQGRLQGARYDAVLEARAQCPTVHRFIDGQLACLQIANGDRRDARDTLDRVLAGGLADVPGGLRVDRDDRARELRVLAARRDRARGRAGRDARAVGRALRRGRSHMAWLGELLPRPAGDHAAPPRGGPGVLRARAAHARALPRAGAPGAHAARPGASSSTSIRAPWARRPPRASLRPARERWRASSTSRASSAVPSACWPWPGDRPAPPAASARHRGLCTAAGRVGSATL